MHSFRIVQALSILIVALGCQTEWSPEHEHGDGESVAFVGAETLATSFEAAGDHLESPVVDAELGAATRVAVLAELQPELDEATAQLRLQARGLTPEGEATEWMDLELAWEEAPMRVLRVTLPHEYPQAQIRLHAADAENLVSFEWSFGVPTPEEAMLAADESAEPEASEVGSRSDALLSGVVSRSAWGARRTRCSGADARKYRVAIHHTVTASNHPSGFAARVRAIQAFHMDGRGWCDVGYHYLITTDGRAWEGRPDSIIGAHVGGANTGNLGVSFVGCFHPDASCASVASPSTPNDAMLSAAASLVRQASSRWGFAIGSGSVKGHRDWAPGSTACPGNHLHARLGTIISRARSGATAPATCTPDEAAECGFLYGCGCERHACECGRRPDSLWLGRTRGNFGGVSDTNVDGLYIPVPGDFDGDGDTDVLWYGYGRRPERLWRSRGNGQFVGRSVAAAGVYLPKAGDFDGDGRDDILWYAPDGNDAIWYGRSDGTFRREDLSARGKYQPFLGDFDGDGRQDIFWYAPGPDADHVYYGHAGGGFGAVHLQVRGRYTPLVGDFDGDGRSDIFWYKPGDSADHVWYGRADHTFGKQRLDVNGHYEPSVGDFDGDGRSDIFWFRPKSTDFVWYGNPTRGSFGRAQVNAGGDTRNFVGDFDGDGRDDILFYGKRALGDHLWYGTPRRGDFAPRDTNVRGDYLPFLGDFDADGRTDVFWYGPGSAGG